MIEAIRRLYQPSRGHFGLEENPNAAVPRSDRFDLGSIDIWLLSILCTTDIALMKLERWPSRRMGELGDIVMQDQSCHANSEIIIHA